MTTRTVEELEAELAKRAEAREKAEGVQYARDLEARLELEEAHGTLAAVRVRFKDGFPTRAYLRTPTEAEYKRFFATIQKTVRAKNDEGVRKAQEQLARAVWVYPRMQEEKDAMIEAFPALLVSIGTCAETLASGKAEDEGKD